MANRILVVVFIFFCFELGFFLVIFPWSQYWENNLFLSYIPSLRDFVLNNFFRAWGHKFVYDEASLTASLLTTGFFKIRRVPLNVSEDPELQKLEHTERLPPGFLELETMRPQHLEFFYASPTCI